jgi:hypothetical protein
VYRLYFSAFLRRGTTPDPASDELHFSYQPYRRHRVGRRLKGTPQQKCRASAIDFRDVPGAAEAQTKN